MNLNATLSLALAEQHVAELLRNAKRGRDTQPLGGERPARRRLLRRTCQRLRHVRPVSAHPETPIDSASQGA